MRFSKLLVISREANTFSGMARWLCSCDCGNTSIVEGRMLRSGHTTSCGCNVGKGRLSHGMSNTPTHQAWINMRARCKSHKRYKGRISVCDRWQSFDNFYEDMGDKPDGLTLDRIDNDGPYSPDNCRWATHRVQMNNTSVNHNITFSGKLLSITEFARQHNMHPETVRRRICKLGWSPRDAVTVKPYQKRPS